MLEPGNNAVLPEIPGKRYFTIGEVSELCDVKPHVLRYWEQEFFQIKPVKRRGNRRYYQRQDVLTIRQIRSLLYEKGFTIGGARVQLTGEKSFKAQNMHGISGNESVVASVVSVADEDMIPVLIENLLVDLEQIAELLSSRELR